ncbi:MAG: UDP-galactopyranose mutase [Clostridia bacterium]|nr:UDP-galactopyranose mutase [Clostridia bacterium]
MAAKKFDFLIVGAGLFGAAFARLATDAGKKCLVIDRRDHIAGNAYTYEEEGIRVHRYGAHILHTSDEEVWAFLNRFARFNHYVNSPVANYKGKLYNLPFNMNTFYQLWGVTTPAQARERLAKEQAQSGITEPKNLEEQAIKLVGREMYEALVEGYTQKQWGRPCRELPAFIIRRLPVRFTFDNNYFNDPHQGIPVGGYTPLVEKLLEGSEVRLGIDFLKNREALSGEAEKIVYTGCIDEYFDYCYGALTYRSVRFETETLDTDNYQGVAVMNFTEAEIPYTRIIEHKHFEFTQSEKTVISREYSAAWQKGDEPYYPVNDEENAALYAKYRALAEKSGVLFGGRLAEYKYYDMDKVVRRAMDLAKEIL